MRKRKTKKFLTNDKELDKINKLSLRYKIWNLENKSKKFLTNKTEYDKINELFTAKIKNIDNWTVKNLERFKENNSSNRKIDERFDLIEDL